MSNPIEDYAMIGDCHTAALVSRQGSVDWLCLPRFDSGACFAALLGTPEHGRWLMAPKLPATTISRRYRPETLILETEFQTDEGRVRVIDFMPPAHAEDDLIRIVEGLDGQVTMRMELVIRTDYGSIIPWVRATDCGIRAIAGPDMLMLTSPVPLHGEEFTTVAEFTVSAGQRLPFQLTWHPSHELVECNSRFEPEEALKITETWWRHWSDKCQYQGPYREQVLRSLITLKALTYEPTGGIVAAPTTSLPEKLGGVRNWDYRFCWVRDATLTLHALLQSGYTEEAAAWRAWLLRAVAGNPAQLNIMYGLAGERRLPELELDWLPGYENSRPVRTGNAAHKQFQLDVFGELMGVMSLCHRAGLPPDENAWRMQITLMSFLEKAWKEPDEGIWEIRGSRRHFTHSKVMAWLAADRMIKEVQQFGLEGPVEDWQRMRAEIHADVCLRGFDATLGGFVQYYGAEHTDASLLMVPIVGFLPASDPRVAGTLRLIEKELLKDGFVQRYRTERDVDGLPPGEGMFLPCTFWLVDNYVLAGRLDEAHALFERLLSLANDVGLLSEEYDVDAKRLVGNFPQAFTHIGLINTAHRLAASLAPVTETAS
jgi:GH15 family glucan-1,4-alpha-glucosidase